MPMCRDKLYLKKKKNMFTNNINNNHMKWMYRRFKSDWQTFES